MPESIEVQSPAEFPSVPLRFFGAKDMDDVRAWVAKHGAKRFWWYAHKSAKIITAAIERDQVDNET